MFCKKCGTQLPDGATTCPECGAAVTMLPPPEPQPPLGQQPPYMAPPVQPYYAPRPKQTADPKYFALSLSAFVIAIVTLIATIILVALRGYLSFLPISLFPSFAALTMAIYAFCNAKGQMAPRAFSVSVFGICGVAILLAIIFMIV